MKIKYIALDIDGTLLDRNYKLSSENKEVILKAQKQGIKVGLVTARGYKAVKNFIEELQLKSLNVIQSGGIILDSSQENQKYYLRDLKIPSNIASKVLELSKCLNLNLMAYKNDEVYCFGKESRFTKLYEKAMQFSLEFVDFENHDLGVEGFGKMLLMQEPEVLDIAFEELLKFPKERISIGRSMPIAMDISAASKVDGLLEVLSYYGFKTDHLMAIGDSLSDIDMIKIAKLGVAMGNAPDEVKKISDYVTYANEENGVAHAILKVLNGEVLE